MGLCTTTYSVKQVRSFRVQVFCMCFIKYGAVLLKMHSNQIPKMIITHVHHISGLISKFFLLLTNILILKWNKTPPIKTNSLP